MLCSIVANQVLKLESGGGNALTVVQGRAWVERTWVLMRQMFRMSTFLMILSNPGGHSNSSQDTKVIFISVCPLSGCVRGGKL